MHKKSIFGAAIAASLMMFGAAAQAQQLPPRGDLDRDGIENRYDRDRDGDGFENRSDPQPNVFNRTRIVRAHDMDGDGIADASDRDRDGDGIPNARDSRPNVPDVRIAGRDRDGDGIANRDDPDNRRFGPYGDLDRDGIQNRYDRDRDGDGVPNRRDARPNNPYRY